MVVQFEDPVLIKFVTKICCSYGPSLTDMSLTPPSLSSSMFIVCSDWDGIVRKVVTICQTLSFKFFFNKTEKNKMSTLRVLES